MTFMKFLARSSRAVKAVLLDQSCIAGLGNLLTDEMFRMRALRVVEAQEGTGTPVYNYIFQWKTTPMDGLLGACHLAEIAFVFGTLDERFSGAGPGAEALSHRIQDAWAAFARTGDERGIVRDKEDDGERQAWDAIPGAEDR